MTGIEEYISNQNSLFDSAKKCLAEILPLIKEDWVRERAEDSLDDGYSAILAIATAYRHYTPSKEECSKYREELKDGLFTDPELHRKVGHWLSSLTEGEREVLTYLACMYAVVLANDCQEWRENPHTQDFLVLCLQRDDAESLRWLMRRDELDEDLRNIDREMRPVALERYHSYCGNPDDAPDQLWSASCENPYGWWTLPTCSPVEFEDFRKEVGQFVS